MKTPNILMIMTDQQRTDSLGCYGSPWVHTPHLDQLAEEGILFENCYVNNTICTPSRASIFTGKPLPGHGVYKLHDILSEEHVLFPKRLQSKGYLTALFGKLHVGARALEANQRHPNDGFDIYENALDTTTNDMNNPLNGAYMKWLRKQFPKFYEQLVKHGRNLRHFPEEVHYSRWAAERTIDFIRSKKEQPFFCCMSLFDPHDPYNDYPVSMLERIDEGSIPKPMGEKGMIRSKPQAVQREHYHSYIGDYNQYTEEQIHQIRVGYHASVAFLDHEIGRVFQVLDEEGLRQNTLIVFVSDHGDMLGDHELLVKGAYFYDACTKVPLIVSLPKKEKAGTRVQRIVQPHDIAATVLKLAGYPEEELGMMMPDSMDLLALEDAGTKEPKQRNYAVCMYRNTGVSDERRSFDPPIHASMLRVERYKLNVYHQLGLDIGSAQGELYDMEQDPNELSNLWDNPDYAAVKNQLLIQLMNSMVDMDLKYNGSPRGEHLPPKSQWTANNAI